MHALLCTIVSLLNPSLLTPPLLATTTCATTTTPHSSYTPQGNERRLTGKHETSSIHDFSWGVANRGCSIRVGRMVPVDTCGYYEDRRPASNLDPYVVTKLLVETTLLM